MMQKLNKLCVVSIFLLTMISCSKDETVKKPDPTPETKLEDVELQLITKPIIADVPTAMRSVNDINAERAITFVTLTKGFNTYLINFKPPENAVISSTPVSDNSGRVAATEYLVYTWNDDSKTIVYQVSQTTTDFIFEVFYKFTEGTEYLKYIYAEESKSAYKGFMEIYNTTSDLGEIGLRLNRFSWENDNETLTLSKAGGPIWGDFENVTVLNPDRSGYADYYYIGEKKYHLEWDNSGNGSWVYYTDNTSGTWSI